MGKLLPIILALIGLGAGAGAGMVLKPDHSTGEMTGKAQESGSPNTASEEAENASVEYVKLNNQFIVPVVENARVTAMVVLSLSLEVDLGERANIYQVEPKLRDAFLQVMFDHANAGGFKGRFTESGPMDILRRALLEIAQKTVGPEISDVLIIDMVRQDN